MTRRVFAVILAVAIGLPLVVLSIWLGAKYVLPATLNMARGMFAAEPPAISAPAATPTPIDVKALAAAVVAALPTQVPPAQAGNSGSPSSEGSVTAGQPAVVAAAVQPQPQLNTASGQPEMAAPTSGGQPAQMPALLPVQAAIPQLSTGLIPLAPYFGNGGDIIDVANAGLNSCGPKCAVYPRVIFGGVYSDQHNRSEWEKAMLQGAARSMGTTDRWSVLSYAGVAPDDNCAWFLPLTEETGDLQMLASGVIEEVVFLDGQRRVIESPVVRLDAMMALCLAQLENVGARALTKNPGVLSLVLVDGQTEGSASVGFAISPQFVNNFTGGSANLVPAVVINGMPGQPLRTQWYDSNGQLVSTTDGQIEATNGTATVEVPVGGNFVVVSLPIVGTGPNSNTEVLFRMSGQPIPDTPGKNWFPAP